jgi:hypothetical protein
MVMRWKILELAQDAGSVPELISKLEASAHFDISKEDAFAILQQYAEILPPHLQEELRLRNTLLNS